MDEDDLDESTPGHDSRVDTRYLDRLTRGPLRSPDEPLVDQRRIVRSLLRGLLLGALLALLGSPGGVRGALAGALGGLIAIPVAWVEFWAERRAGSNVKDLEAFALAALAAALGLLLVGLEYSYVDALLRGRGVSGAMHALGRTLRNASLWTLWGFAISALLPASAFGLSVLQRLRRYLPADIRGRIPTWAYVLVLALAGGLAVLASLSRAAQAGGVLLILLVVLVAIWYFVVAVLGALYHYADELELELHLWRERRAEEVRE
ncbi:MAG: hypothetical protein AB7N76_26810 [Planctomycetota bacterium]